MWLSIDKGPFRVKSTAKCNYQLHIGKQDFSKLKEGRFCSPARSYTKQLWGNLLSCSESQHLWSTTANHQVEEGRVLPLASIFGQIWIHRAGKSVCLSVSSFSDSPALERPFPLSAVTQLSISSSLTHQAPPLPAGWVTEWPLGDALSQAQTRTALSLWWRWGLMNRWKELRAFRQRLRVQNQVNTFLKK